MISTLPTRQKQHHRDKKPKRKKKDQGKQQQQEHTAHGHSSKKHHSSSFWTASDNQPETAETKPDNGNRKMQTIANRRRSKPEKDQNHWRQQQEDYSQ